MYVWKKHTALHVFFSGLLIAAGVCTFGDQAFAYVGDGLLVSKNLLSSEGASRRIISFTYTASSIPANTTLQVQFSQFSGTGSAKWFNASGTRHGWNTMSSGTHTIDLTGLHWSGTKFYYRVYFTSSDGVNTPVLDSVSVEFDSNVGRYDTYNSTGALVSANLLPSVSVDNMSGVTITVSVLPTQTNLAIQFSQNSTSWYNASGILNGSNALWEGSNNMNISGLGWSGRQFYYRVNYASSGTTTAMLSDMSLVLNTGTGTVQYVGTGSYAELSLGDSYRNLTLSGAGTWTLDAALDVNRTFSLTRGTFRQGAYSMNVAGDMRIAAGTTFTKSTNGSRLILDGNLTLENEAGANLGNVQIGSSPDTITLSGSLIADRLTIGSGDTLITNGFNVIVGTGGITNSGTIVASGGIGGTTDISTASGFVNHGTFRAGGSILTISGSFINKGTFTANTGSVVLDGASQTLSGSTIFYNLAKTVTSADTLTFAANKTFTVTNALTLNGATSNLLSLRSSISGTQWKINPQGTRTISYLNVKDSNNTNATYIDAANGTFIDSGNNTNWQIVTPEISFQSGSLTVSESVSSITLTILLSGSTLRNVTVPYYVKGTATGTGTDFTLFTRSPLTLNASETSTGVIITLINDSTVEVDKTIVLTLNTPTNATVGQTGSITITLTSDDVAAAASSSSDSVTTVSGGGGGGRRTVPGGSMARLIEEASRTLLARFREGLTVSTLAQKEKNSSLRPRIARAVPRRSSASSLSRATRSLRDVVIKPGKAGSNLPEIASRRGRLLMTIDDTDILFADVDTDAWYAPYVATIISEEIAQGYKDADGNLTWEFGVANPVTRAEILKMALEAAKQKLVTDAPRNSTARGTWASHYVATAEKLRLRVFPTNINVHEPATRGEVIQIILDAMGFVIGKTTSTFDDVPVDHPYSRAIALAAFNGFIEGDRGPGGQLLNRLRPDDHINRVEVAKIIALMREVAKK